LTDMVETAMNKGFPAGMLALDRLESGPVEWSGRLPADPSIWDLDDVVLAGEPDVELSIDAFRGAGAHVRGRLGAPVELNCRRCLEGITRRVGVDLDLRFDPGIGPEDEEDGLYALDPDAPELDLLPALREELLLALPEFPLCRPDCKGICPTCGSNRNEGDCDCRVEQVDPRWDALRQRFPQEPDAAEGAGLGSDDG
jgi:uncharacterized protein